MAPTYQAPGRVYVFRSHSGLCAYALKPRDELIEVFDDLPSAIAFCERQNGYTGPVRELSLASLQARKAA